MEQRKTCRVRAAVAHLAASGIRITDKALYKAVKEKRIKNLSDNEPGSDDLVKKPVLVDLKEVFDYYSR